MKTGKTKQFVLEMMSNYSLKSMKKTLKLEKIQTLYVPFVQLQELVLQLAYLKKLMAYGVEYILTKARYLESLTNIRASKTGLTPGRV